MAMNADGARLLSGTPEIPPGCVALTFDDGPGPRSAELARMLRDEGIPATFFVLGESLEHYADVLDVIRECGHTIGLHAERHVEYRSPDQAAHDLRRCAERVRERLGDREGETVWYRPPYGKGNWQIPGLAGPVGWHVQGRDWEVTYRRGQTVEACVDAIVQGIRKRDGGIVLLHDYAAATEFTMARLTADDLDLRVVEMTKLLIERVRNEGLTFIALPEPPQALEKPAFTPPISAAPPGMVDDIKSLRLFRSNAKSAGGTLDLVMPIRVGGDGPTLFCAHPMVGLSWCYLSLLPHLDTRFPLYGLQARGLRRPEPVPPTMADMARDYADQIRMIQPNGPYHLLGWSLGGNIAFAIAEELQQRGEEIGLLVIMDSTLVDLAAMESDQPWMIFNLVLAQFGYVPALTASEPDPEARMLELVRRRPGLGLDEWSDQRIRALQRVIKNNAAVGLGHQPGRVRCPLLFFSAVFNDPTLPEKLDNWGRYIDGPIEAIEIHCHHRYMLLPEPSAKMGPAISDRLARTESVLKAGVVQPG